MTFKPGLLYEARDGRRLFVMSAVNDEIDVWCRRPFGEYERVGVMTPAQLGELVVEPSKPDRGPQTKTRPKPRWVVPTRLQRHAKRSK